MNIFYVILYTIASLAAQLVTAWGAGVLMRNESPLWWILLFPLLCLHGFAFQENREYVAKKIMNRE